MNAVELAFRNADQTRSWTSASHRALPRVLLAVVEHSTCLLVSRNLEQAGINVVGRADSPAEIARLTKTNSPELLVIDDDLYCLLHGNAPRQNAVLPAVLLISAERHQIDGATPALIPAMGAVGAPFSARNLLPAVEIAYARSTEQQRLRDRVDKLRLRLAARTPIDHAKSF